jgi:UDP-N-acetylglucosamine 1-carboxyvinyltransferase
MRFYEIDGGYILRGEIDVSGSKNATLPIIAAALLNEGISVIKNVPDIRDVKMMCSILKTLGCKITREKDVLIIDASTIISSQIPEDLMREMRSSVIIVGALLGRKKSCTFTYPGGCEIGSRPINLHLDAFKLMGVDIVEQSGNIECNAKNLLGTEIMLDFPSVGATENIMLASVLSDGITYIKNVAREPEIICLQDFLNSMGADIIGAGTNTIKIKGVKRLHDTEFPIISDRIEAGTYMCMVAATRGELVLNNVCVEHIAAIIHKLKQMNCKIHIYKNKVKLSANRALKATNIKTMPYPGFPTDMQSQFVTTLALAEGTSIIVENIFENRFKYVPELIKMGANIMVEGTTAIVQGVDSYSSANVQAKDLRGGAALIGAALAANGVSKIEGIDFVERGYENLVKKLTILGAKIRKQ